jgi:hypothetical protein
LARCQPVAAFVLTGKHFDLVREALDALIQPAPVSCQVLDDPQHVRREHVGALRQDARQLGTQEAQSLPHRDAAI